METTGDVTKFPWFKELYKNYYKGSSDEFFCFDVTPEQNEILQRFLFLQGYDWQYTEKKKVRHLEYQLSIQTDGDKQLYYTSIRPLDEDPDGHVIVPFSFMQQFLQLKVQEDGNYW